MSGNLSHWTGYGKENLPMALQVICLEKTCQVWPDKAARKISRTLHLHCVFFNKLCQFCLAYYKKLTEIQNALSYNLWTITQRGQSLTALIRASGNDLATKIFKRAMAELIGATHRSLLCATLSPPHPHWTVGLNVNQCINTAKNSS